jgi:hypothetical protein
MQDLKIFLLKFSKNLTTNEIFENDMSEYNYFYSFIKKHYSLEHIKEHNYLKYVKISRQKICYEKCDLYENYINKITSIIDTMVKNNLFNNFNIKKYLFKLNKINILLEKKKFHFHKLIAYYRVLNEKYSNNEKFKLKILFNINALSHKYQLFIQMSKQLKYNIQNLIILEEKYDIDHKLIEINNLERTLLGKKSEYKVEKILKDYVKYNTNYIYLINIDFIKLLQLDLNSIKNIKGEVDALLIYLDGKDYIIEYFIEVKSSIKSTYEDVLKFINLKKIIESLDENKIFTMKNTCVYFTKKSFNKIINKKLSEAIIYLCIDQRSKIEKSHFYFAYVLKILDSNFIKKYYINNDESIIKEKYKLIIDNKNFVNKIFDKWVKDVALTNESSCIFLINSI